MICYIYKIINIDTNEKYVGQTTNFSRRISEHFSKLKSNSHPNPKLQNSWNKYGEKNFIVEKKRYNLSKEELDCLEIKEIAKENSFLKGFNLTAGGTGGDTRSKVKEEDFYEIYFGNLAFQGLMNRTGEYYGCDSSTVSHIVRGMSYDKFREKAEIMSQKEREEKIERFKQKLRLNENPSKPQRKKLKNSEIIVFLCLLSTYGRGIEAAFLRENNLSKGLGFHLQKGEYKEAQKDFFNINDEEIEKIAINYFETKNLQNKSKVKIPKKEKVEKPSWIAH